MNNYTLFHTHGLGSFDFSTISVADLASVDAIAAARNAFVCPTVYLRPERMISFERLLEAFAAGKDRGLYPRLMGFAIEGPVLGPRGGTPRGSVWRPDAKQWTRIASWFNKGLKYIVVSPDMLALDEELDSGLTFGGLITLIYDLGGRIALGHFSMRGSPTDSASRVAALIQHIEERYCRSRYLILTDHLFNDMPLSFRHAFRNEAATASREQALAPILETPWSPSTLPSLLGPVPAALLEAARRERLTPSLNFDGGHVDLEVCRQVVRYLGPSRVIAITDHTEQAELAGEGLREVGELLYRHDGVLAASNVRHEQQRENMRKIDLSETEIEQVFFITPMAALQFRPARLASGGGV